MSSFECPFMVQEILDELHIALSFVGIQGYPVKAIYNYCFPL